MAKFVSPQLGYNNNVRHRGRVFHVQTEDSGVNHPHIITHLFMDGGRILKSVKKSYAEHIGSDNLKETVRGLMKEQHKAMFIALRDGQFDELVDGKKPSNPEVPKVTPSAPKLAEGIPEAPPTKPDLVSELAPPSSKDAKEETPPNTIDESRRPPPEVAAAQAEPFALEANGPNTVPEAMPGRKGVTIPPPTINERHDPQNEPRRPSAAELTLDFDALERDTGSSVSPMFQSNDLPPPPKNMFTKERGTGAYSTLEVDAHHQSDDTRAPAPARPSTAPRKSLPPASKGENGRYTATRPATIFGSTIKPAAPTSSIFGDELVSDKSLDEVILSYLAEDLEPRK